MYILLLRKHQERCANMPYESHYIPFGRSEMQPRHFTLAKIEQLVCRPTPLSSCFPAEILSVYIVEYYTHFKILKYIPITTKWELISWVWAILILLPFIIYIYVRYYKPPKLSNLKLIYESKSNIRLILGRLFYVCYCLITWIGFFIIVGCFKH